MAINLMEKEYIKHPNKIYTIESRFKGIKEFNLLTVVEYVGHYNKLDYWNCLCKCGGNIIVNGRSLLSGNTATCGCMHKNSWIVGKKFNRLFVEKFDSKRGSYIYWKCLCECGEYTVVNTTHLITGDIKSCGCLWKEKKIKHGMDGTRFYYIWGGMTQRCLNKNHHAYKDYGGRGIKVCDEWLESFENFRDDMYESYLEHCKEFGEDNTSIDRYPNNNGNYELGNVRWATRKEQNNNRRSTPILIDKKEQKRWKVLFSLNIARIIRGNKDSRNALCDKYFGILVENVRTYLLSNLQSDMTIENYGRGLGKWCIDHIIGCNNFDLSREEDRKECFNINNLQPKWWSDNASKSKGKVNSNRNYLSPKIK